jgi:hypothetical protein
MKTPEQRLESRELRELRKQVIRLKRENAQLRKRNSRIENDFADFRDDLMYESLQDEGPEVRKEQTPCPKCGSKDIHILELRGLPYYKCANAECESKGKLPQQK